VLSNLACHVSLVTCWPIKPWYCYKSVWEDHGMLERAHRVVDWLPYVGSQPPKVLQFYTYKQMMTCTSGTKYLLQNDYFFACYLLERMFCSRFWLCKYVMKLPSTQLCTWLLWHGGGLPFISVGMVHRATSQSSTWTKCAWVVYNYRWGGGPWSGSEPWRAMLLHHGGSLPFISVDVAPGVVYPSSARTWHPECCLPPARRWAVEWWKPPTCEASDGDNSLYWVIIEDYGDNSLSPSIAIRRWWPWLWPLNITNEGENLWWGGLLSRRWHVFYSSDK
jgi:hypothetical protein